MARTKEEFIELYGEVDACECDGCGEFFLPEEAKSAIEPHGEEVPICPVCGSSDLRWHESYEMRREEDEADM